MSKCCVTCKQIKATNQFYKKSLSKDGFQSQCKLCSNERVAYKRTNNREYMRSYSRSEAGKAALRKHRLKKYGLTPESFKALLVSQSYCCACCGTNKPHGNSNQWNVDHCHTTGKVRGLLCNSCNIGIGCLGDNLQGVRNALHYLERHYNDKT